MENREILWNLLEKDIDLYKFYLQLIIKASVFIFGITGAIVSYYLAHRDTPYLQLSLIVPIIMCGAFSFICLKGKVFADVMCEEHYRISDELGIKTVYEFSPLPDSLIILFILFGVISIALIILMIFSELLIL
jgi:hypothetical protein